MESELPILILGAGLTGLSAAAHLGQPYRLIEKDGQVGGLAKTRVRPGGFHCDGTGHWLHLRQPYTKAWVEKLMGANLATRSRRARIYSQGVYTLYPFQANTYGLPKEVVAECLLGFLQAKEDRAAGRGKKPENFLEWIEAEFGPGICRHFMRPYNEKIYGVPLDTLAANFAERYVPRPGVEQVVKGALGLSPEALGYNASFVYPKTGGIGALSTAIHQSLPRPAELNREPASLDLAARTALLKDGETISFRRLVSTLPLPVLVKLALSGNSSVVPDQVVEAAGRLRANSVLYFDIGLKGAPKEHQDYHWVYLPERSFAFYRVGSYSAVEPSLAPPGHRSYYVEFGHYGDVDPRQFEAPLLDGLRRLGILEHEAQVVFLTPHVLNPAYVLFDAHYEQARATILDWLKGQGVVSVGRYGRWQYNAMEDALLEGKEAAEICRGERQLS